MPRKGDFERNRRFERMMGLKPSDFYGDEHLSAEEAAQRRLATNEAMRRIRESPHKGKLLGHMVWNEDAKDFIFEPLKDGEDINPISK